MLNNFFVCDIKMISKWYHLNERISVHHRNTLVFTTNTLNQIIADSKNKTLVSFFGYFWSFLLPPKIWLAVNVHKYYKMHLEKSLFSADGDRFTFTIGSYFRRIGIVVPHNSHATKSTPIPQNHSTYIFGQNLTIPYPNSPSTLPSRTTIK